jgi:hypothetical protein
VPLSRGRRKKIANATLAEARAYYLGQKFQFGDSEEHPGDKLVEAVAVEEL